ncbi:MAG: flagellar hook-basal body complex protein FliE [Oscillospiraceae bacterium]|nr:flagellar hook-basal body complex protein FliE [Oscillospiraceae bacterium]
MISPIEGLKGIQPIAAGEENVRIAEGTGDMFSAIFRNAIQNVKETDAEKTQAEYLLSTGQLDNPSSMMIALSKYQTSVDLLVQLRNKAQDAYSELMRINL